MILVDRTIKSARENGGLSIKPFNPENLQGNAYDVHLGATLMVIEDAVCCLLNEAGQIVDISPRYDFVIDCKKPVKMISFEIPENGYELQPGVLYLGVTTEKVGLTDFAANLEGKSSVGRFGIEVHRTAGLIDAGFDGFITLEISVIHPTRVYAGMPIGQLVFQTLTDKPINPYNLQKYAKYNGQIECVPVASQFYKNFNQETGLWA